MEVNIFMTMAQAKTSKRRQRNKYKRKKWIYWTSLKEKLNLPREKI